MAFFVVHCAGRVLRLIEAEPNGEAKAKLATQCIPHAAYELCQGQMPDEGDDVEAFALRFKHAYLERTADAWLLAHRDTEIPEEPTKVERPSGIQKRISLVTDN